MEVNREAEFVPTTDIITTGATTPSKSRPAINFILGGLFDDQYQSKSQQKKLLRAVTIKAWVNVVHTGGSQE